MNEGRLDPTTGETVFDAGGRVDYSLGDALNEMDDENGFDVAETVEGMIGGGWDEWCQEGSELAIDGAGTPALSRRDGTVIFRTRDHLVIVLRVEVLPEPGYE